MLPLTATDLALLTAANLTVDFGAELLDANDMLIEDISADLIGGTPSRKNYADVHGTCSIDLLRALDWPNARVRLYQTLTAGTLTKRYNMGTFLPTVPDHAVGETPPTFSVGGMDKLHLLQGFVGDTYVVPTGDGYLAAATAAITAAGVTGLAPLFDGAAQNKTLTEPMVWVLDPSDLTSWLRVINDLLAAIGYRGLWVDGDGRFRSEPYQNPATRPSEYTFDLNDPNTNIVGDPRTYSVDEFEALNWWRFIRDGMNVAPVEGAGQYTVDRSAGGVQRRKPVKVTAADQAALVSLGDRTVTEDTLVTRRLKITTGPMPVLGHFDVVTLIDPVLGTLKCLVHSYSTPLNGDEVTYDLEVIG